MSQSAARILDIIDAISVADTPLPVMEIACRTGLNKSTCSRLLKVLADRQYVIRDEDFRRFRAGPTLLALSATIAKRSELIRIAHPYLESIRNESGETTSLHLRVGKERLCIDAVDRVPPQVHIQPLGLRSPLFMGTSGKVILAHLDPASVAELLGDAETAGHALPELEVDLARVRESGFLVGVSPKTRRHTTVSAPLFRDTSIFGAVTVTGPLERWGRKQATDYADRLKELAGTISVVVSTARIFVYQ